MDFLIEADMFLYNIRILFRNVTISLYALGINLFALLNYVYNKLCAECNYLGQYEHYLYGDQVESSRKLVVLSN